MSGVAGAGKSTWIKNFIICKPENSVFVVSLDDLRLKMFGKYSNLTHQEEKQMWKEAIEEAKQASTSHSYIIIDSTALKNKRRMWYYENLKDYCKNFTLVILDRPLETCLTQNRQRERQVPNRVIEEMYNYKEEPNEEVIKSYNNILRINKK
jgi:predicted kinase